MSYNLINLLQNGNRDEELFLDKVDSKLKMDIRKNEIIDDDEWIDMVDFTIPHLEKALNKSIKQIIQEEEIIKIELIKKVSVESIKHLSKNTNLIEQYDEETEDIIPSKILNAYKEETFITYENRFLYTLIKLIDDFIYLRTREMEDDSLKGRNKKKASYEATTKINKERVKLNFEYTSELEEPKSKTKDAGEKLEKIKKGLVMVKATEMFKFLSSKRIVLVKSPLKMTNVLLKNVHFQYAVKLWNYLNSHMDAQNKAIKKNKDYEEKGMTKQLIDEDFFLKYLIFKDAALDPEKKLKPAITDPIIRKEMTELLIEKIIDINPHMTDRELKELIANKYVQYKVKKDISLKPLEEIFRKNIESYLQKVEKMKLL